MQRDLISVTAGYRHCGSRQLLAVIAVFQLQGYDVNLHILLSVGLKAEAIEQWHS